MLPDGDRRVCFKTIALLVSLVLALPGDVARYDTGSYAIECDASANGVPDGSCCDALAVDPSTRRAGGVDFDDEDVVMYSPASADWALLLDASARDADWGQADADAVAAVPGPSIGLMITAGSTALAVWRRRLRP